MNVISLLLSVAKYSNTLTRGLTQDTRYLLQQCVTHVCRRFDTTIHKHAYMYQNVGNFHLVQCCNMTLVVRWHKLHNLQYKPCNMGVAPRNITDYRLSDKYVMLRTVYTGWSLMVSGSIHKRDCLTANSFCRVFHPLWDMQHIPRLQCHLAKHNPPVNVAEHVATVLYFTATLFLHPIRSNTDR